MYCPYCGTPLLEGANCCVSCGQGVSAPAESERDPGPRLRVFEIVKTLQIGKPAKSRKKLLRALSKDPNDFDLNVLAAFECLREPQEKSTSAKYLKAAPLDDRMKAAGVIAGGLSSCGNNQEGVRVILEAGEEARHLSSMRIRCL